MLFPDFIKKEAILGVTACSDGRTEPLDVVRLQQAVKAWENLHYSVKVTPNTYTSKNGRSDDALTRAQQLMQLATMQKVGAVFQVCGGDYLCEVLPYLDYRLIAENPRWYQGFSDATGLLYSITTICDLATIYGENFTQFGMEKWHESLVYNQAVLEGAAFSDKNKGYKQASFARYQPDFGEKKTGLEGYSLTQPVVWKAYNEKGERTDAGVKFGGRQLGGCLDVLVNLIGTPYEHTKQFVRKYAKDGVVWCMESFELGAAALTRALWQLKSAGWFQHATGFVFGRPTFYREDYDIPYEQAVLEALSDLKLPMIFDADFGHRPPRIPLILGGMSQWQCEGKQGSVTQWLK